MKKTLFCIQGQKLSLWMFQRRNIESLLSIDTNQPFHRGENKNLEHFVQVWSTSCSVFLLVAAGCFAGLRNACTKKLVLFIKYCSSVLWNSVGGQSNESWLEVPMQMERDFHYLDLPELMLDYFFTQAPWMYYSNARPWPCFFGEDIATHQQRAAKRYALNSFHVKKWASTEIVLHWIEFW